MVQYSNGAGRWSRSRADLPVFMKRSAAAHTITIRPKTSRDPPPGPPMRNAVTPKMSLNRQKGIPMVKLRKNGRTKNRWMASISLRTISFSGEQVSCGMTFLIRETTGSGDPEVLSGPRRKAHNHYSPGLSFPSQYDQADACGNCNDPRVKRGLSGRKRRGRRKGCCCRQGFRRQGKGLSG